MAAERATAWNRRMEDFLDRPRVARSAILMLVFVGGHVVTTSLSALVLVPSGYLTVHFWVPTMVAICSFIGLSASSLVVAWRRDPDGRLRSTRAALMAATGYAVCGTVMAYSFGLWASPFAALPLVWTILVAVVLDRRHALAAATTSAVVVVVLEAGRFALDWDVAPALAPLSDRSVGSWQVAVGSAIPMVTFGIVTATVTFAVLALLDRQRTALQSAHELIRTYVPAQVADAVLERGAESVTTLERRKITIFFSDVVTFTETTDRMEPEELAHVLGEYFSEMTRIAEKYDGTIDELIGDAVLIFFGAPTATDDRDHAVRAVQMAVEMQAAVRRLNASWARSGIDAAFEIRMGINTGVVTVGNVGSGARRKYAALGRAVNLAARIQTYCRPGGILISRPTWLLVQDDVACELVDTIELKGVGRPTELYAVDLSAALAGE